VRARVRAHISVTIYYNSHSTEKKTQSLLKENEHCTLRSSKEKKTTRYGGA
jgi:hypothetical protein